jgi:hypothetical protein
VGRTRPWIFHTCIEARFVNARIKRLFDRQSKPAAPDQLPPIAAHHSWLEQMAAASGRQAGQFSFPEEEIGCGRELIAARKKAYSGRPSPMLNRASQFRGRF